MFVGKGARPQTFTHAHVYRSFKCFQDKNTADYKNSVPTQSMHTYNVAQIYCPFNSSPVVSMIS